MIEGNILKMVTDLQSPVEYQLPIGDQKININDLLGKKISFSFNGDINCVNCGRKTKKSFSQGHCFPCMRDLAACDMCIVKPELCHYDQGTCREPEWGEKHCLQDHFVYLANSSGVKVGITRATQIPTRWMDQGAIQALKIGIVKNRLQSGIAEMALKEFVADKTNWRTMLKGEVEPIDLEERRDELLDYWPDEVMGEPLYEEEVVEIEYPILEYPTKISSLNLDKVPTVEGTLAGIKGQYLILDIGVINMRKYQGYHLSWDL